MTRAIIAGGRFNHMNDLDRTFLDAIAREKKITLVITGGATGIDAAAHVWAKQSGIQTAVMDANWPAHGKPAGPMRNRAMADVCGKGGLCILFPGGRGTASMKGIALAMGLEVIER